MAGEAGAREHEGPGAADGLHGVGGDLGLHGSVEVVDVVLVEVSVVLGRGGDGLEVDGGGVLVVVDAFVVADEEARVVQGVLGINVGAGQAALRLGVDLVSGAVLGVAATDGLE